jgi:hypothetical protein
MTSRTTALFADRPTVAVLRNKGVPVRVHETQPAPTGSGRWERVLSADPDEPTPVWTQVHVRFTALDLAEIEEKFGSIQAWNEALNGDKSHSSVIDTLALLWGYPRERAGVAMIDGDLDGYAAAIGAAFLLANGGEADAVVRVLASRITVTGTKRKIQALGVGAQLEEEERLVQEAEKALTEYRETQNNKPSPKKATRKRVSGSTGANGSNSGSELVAATTSSGP